MTYRSTRVGMVAMTNKVLLFLLALLHYMDSAYGLIKPLGHSNPVPQSFRFLIVFMA